MAKKNITLTKGILLRILSAAVIAGTDIKAGHVVEVDEITAAGLIDGGVADDNADAVAYALTENPDVIVLLKPDPDTPVDTTDTILDDPADPAA